MDQKQTLEVSELFYSIQGESTFTGLPCVFVRLSGCNLRCSYCDSRYSYEEKGTTVSIDDIVAYTDKYPAAIIEITGGEPLLQENIYLLIDQILSQDKKRKILIETNGSLPIDSVPWEVTVILDVKTPGSSHGDSFLQSNLELLKERFLQASESCEIKFVLTGQSDYEWAKSFYYDNLLIFNFPVLFSAVQSHFSPSQLAASILQDQLPVRMQLQLHSFIWPKMTRGV